MEHFQSTWYVNSQMQVVIVEEKATIIYDISVIFAKPVAIKGQKKKIPAWSFDYDKIILAASGMNFRFEDAHKEMASVWETVHKDATKIKSNLYPPD
jgi:hypothetical protein